MHADTTKKLVSKITNGQYKNNKNINSDVEVFPTV